MRRIVFALLAVLFLAGSLAPFSFAQEGSATLTGFIQDSSKALIPGVKVTAIDTATNVRFETTTGKDGSYTISSLPVGPYQIQVEKPGFKTILKDDLFLHTQDTLQINFEMAVGSTAETVTVSGNNGTNDSPAVSMTVDREFVENMPLNGRSFQDLIQLAPGTIDSPKAGSGSGYYAIDGQRSDANNYTVDGVSANLGGVVNLGGQSNIGTGLAGAVPAQSTLGTTQSLTSIDSLQEFSIQTSGYAAEFGRSPGGQVQFTTRSGTNDLHGTIFDFLRNTAFDANSYGNDYHNIPQTAEHQNDFGGTIGGPIVIPKLYDGRNRSFYFFSYEGLRLLLPNYESEYVPTQALRESASPNAQPFLNVAPMPNGPTNNDGCTTDGTPTGPACDAMFNYGYSYPNNLDSLSLRIDDAFGERYHAFARYSDTPSSRTPGAEQTDPSVVNMHEWTAGLTTNISDRLLEDLRFNFSHDGEQLDLGQRSVNGSTPLSRSLLIPTQYAGPYSAAESYVEIPGTPLATESQYGGSATAQHQYQLVDSLTWTKGAHTFKFGGDWRRLSPNWSDNPYASAVVIVGLTDLQQGIATDMATRAIAPGQPVFYNLSFYGQDHWRATTRLTLDFGLRWDFNPPPGPSNGEYPVTLTSGNLSTATIAPLGTKPYKTDYHSFGPRVGFAWNAIPLKDHPVTVRGGFGIFFDTAQQAIGETFAGAYPFVTPYLFQFGLMLPLTDSELAPPPLNFPLVAPYPSLGNLASPDLTAPYTEQWNLSIDEAINLKNTLTVSYVGNNGRKLLFTDTYSSIPGNSNLTYLGFTNNQGQSSYNALQVQDVGRLVNGLNAVASFTLSHALDNASEDSGSAGPIFGNSDNDVRRVLNLALNYEVPTIGHDRLMESFVRGWSLAQRFTTESGVPLDVSEASIVLPDGAQTTYYPNLVPNVPIYLHGAAANVNGAPVQHAWRLNRAAFACTTTGATSGPCTGTPTQQGTLGRNFLRTPPFWAFNTSLQRSLPLYEQLHLNFRVDAFNLLNHPNLTLIDNGLSDSIFGQSNGYAGTIGSSNALYAMGSARSLQLSLKLQF
jgi:hypothetical protein